MSPLSSTLLPILQETSALLQTRRFGRQVRGYAVADSTNSLAMHWADEGAPEGSVVFAESQTAGRGRFGRAWHADAGQNLMFSVILRPSLPPPRLHLVTLASSIALAETVEHQAAPLQATIKWPNDLLLEGLKCCGMLLESSLAGPTAPTVILGIGLNVNQLDFPDGFADRATSLLLQTGRRVPRAPLLADLLRRLEQYYDLLGTAAELSIRRHYEARLHGLGRPVHLRLTEQGTAVTGTLLGITDAGALRLETPQGVRIFHAGNVTFALRDMPP